MKGYLQAPYVGKTKEEYYGRSYEVEEEEYEMEYSAMRYGENDEMYDEFEMYDEMDE